MSLLPTTRTWKPARTERHEPSGKPSTLFPCREGSKPGTRAWQRARIETFTLEVAAESIDEQARRMGIRPIRSADDLAQDGIFDTDEGLDALLAHVVAMRHADLA